MLRPLCLLLLLIPQTTQNSAPQRSEPTSMRKEPTSQTASDAARWQAYRKARDAEEANALNRRERIRRELKMLGEHEWAGVYSNGGGRSSVTLHIAPKSGCAYTWYGCLGWYDVNHGGVLSTSDDAIVLDWKIDPELSRYDAVAATMVRVRWGDRRYLIPKTQMLIFCDDVNSGRLRRSLKCGTGSYLLREEDGETDVSGLPVVPKEYRSWILREPILARATDSSASEPRIERDDEGDIVLSMVDVTLTLDVGRDAGVFEGLCFYAAPEASKLTAVASDSCPVSGVYDVPNGLRVIAATRNTCTVCGALVEVREIDGEVYSDGDPTVPALGDAFSTYASW